MTTYLQKKQKLPGNRWSGNAPTEEATVYVNNHDIFYQQYYQSFGILSGEMAYS